MKKKQKIKDCFLYFMIAYNHKHIWILKSEYARNKGSGRLLSKLLLGPTSQECKVDYVLVVSQQSWEENKEYKVEPTCFRPVSRIEILNTNKSYFEMYRKQEKMVPI